MAPVTESIDSVLEQVPPAYRDSLHVLVALGEAALRRGLHSKAEEWWQAALDNNDGSNLDSVKVALGAALMEPVVKDFPLIVAGQLRESQKQSLERAVNLFTEVLGGLYPNPNNLSRLGFAALMNRASASRLLGKYDEAIRDVDIALQKEPNNPGCIKQRALLAHEQGDDAAACSYLQSILWFPDVPEVPLLAADFLISYLAPIGINH